MVGISKKLEEKRAKLARLIERKAFDAYVRHGVVPDDMQRLAETAADDQKFLDLCAGLSTKALPDGRPTTHYTWRTAGDDRVRHTHSTLEGQVFAWTSAPSEGHPGTAPNCRCWAEPYYGNPALPDAFLQLISERHVSNDPLELWASIETLTRPDGSVAASSVVMSDGTTIGSTFAGQSVSQHAAMPGDTFYRYIRSGEAREALAGRDGQVLASVAWLRGTLTRELLVPPASGPMPMPLTEPPSFPGESSLLQSATSPFAIMMRGAAAIYNMATAAPGPMGVGGGDLSVLAFKIWSGTNAGSSIGVTQEALTQQQAAQICQSLPEVQAWTNEAGALMLPQRTSMRPSEWGTRIHTLVHLRVQALKAALPAKYANIYSELTVMAGRDSAEFGGPVYAQAGTSRLDVVEKVRPNLYCVMDIKAGTAGLTPTRILEILSKLPIGVQVYIMEVRPFE
ncbi:phage minor head protein [Devosia riboflavina]